MVQLVPAFLNNFVLIDPHVAFPRQHIHMRFRFPVRVRLASIRIAKRDMHAGKFFVLQQNPNHFREAEIRSKRQLADTVAVFIRMAVIPELFF